MLKVYPESNKLNLSTAKAVTCYYINVCTLLLTLKIKECFTYHFSSITFFYYMYTLQPHNEYLEPVTVCPEAQCLNMLIIVL